MSERDDEVWRPVCGYEGVYEVSSLGRVRSLKRTAPLPFCGGSRTVPEKILTVNVLDGRAVMQLHRDGHSVARPLAAVVLEAFVGPCQPGQVIHYQDGDRRNCRLANLAYVTPLWQRELDQVIGPHPMRPHPTAKLTPLEARAIAGSSERAIDLAARYGIVKGTVDAIRQGRLWADVTRDVRREPPVRRPHRHLTEPEVVEILASTEPASVLLQRYGIHSSVLSNLRTGKSWKHLSRPVRDPEIRTEPGEEWRPVPGYDGTLLVSNLGRVKSPARTLATRQGPHQLPEHLHHPGTYQRTASLFIRREGVTRYLMIGRIVLEAFVGPRPKGHQLHFRDGDRHNCRLDNLSYERVLQFGNRTSLTVEQARAICQSAGSAAEVAARFGIARSTVRAVWCGQRLGAETANVRKASYRQAGVRKLTDDQVREIRASPESAPVLAERFEVRMTLIRKIRRGKSGRSRRVKNCGERIAGRRLSHVGKDWD